MPPPQGSELRYDELYSQPFQKTATYIRFSQTVEECIGCTYDLKDADVAFLKSYNQKRPVASQLSEDDFEQIMEVFEDTAHYKTPFASVDQTIVPYEDMVQGLQGLETANISAMSHAKEAYEYWKSRRQASSNLPLHPMVKFEIDREKDDLDPYVCFRRREVRQTRKTRARDAQSADKLKRLRRELEDGRQLILTAYHRELLKAEILRTDRAIYEQRAQLKEQKKRLGIKANDEDLINVKVSTLPTKHRLTGTVTNGRHCSPRRSSVCRMFRPCSGHLSRPHCVLPLCAPMDAQPTPICLPWQIDKRNDPVSWRPTW